MTAMPASSTPSDSLLRPRVFGARPFHCDGELLALRFAPDGSLWSVEEPGVLRHWNCDGRAQLGWHELAGPEAVWCFSPAAHYVAAGSDELCLWRTNDGELLACWPQASWVTALAFQPGGLLLASGHDDGYVRLWDYPSGRLASELRPPLAPPSWGGDWAVSALAFSPDGRMLAVAAENRIILLWNVASGTLAGQLQGHSDRIPALTWHPDGRRLISAGWDAAARVWDTAACLLLALLDGHDGQVQALALSPDGQRLACADSSSAVHLWDLSAYRKLAVHREEDREVRSLTFHPDGQSLASGGAGRIIYIWDASEWRAGSRRRPEGSTRGADAIPLATRTCVAISPDGRRLASLSAGTPLRIWDTATTELVLELEDRPPLQAFAASSDGRWFAGSVARPEGVEDARSTLFLWRADSGRRHRRLDGPTAPLTLLAFHPHSTWLAGAGLRSGDVWLWPISSGEPLVLSDVVAGCGVEALAFSPQGALLAVSGVDWLAPRGAEGRIVLWDMLERKSLAVLPVAANSLAFHPSGRCLAAATLTQSIAIWDTERRRQTGEWLGHLDSVTSIAYSPDGRWLASGSDDRTLRLWDADTGQPCGLVELDTQIKALAFAPDGLSLFTGNGTTSCYQIEVRQILANRAW